MKEELNVNFLSKMRKSAIVGFSIVLACALVFVLVSLADKNRNEEKSRIKNHIKVVMTIDRNCNECHLGESFVNLFNHDAVKSNDNVVRFVMNKVNIKQW